MISEQIADYVRAKGINQAQMARAIGILPQSMSDTLHGRRALKAEEYRAICKYLEVPYDKFMGN